MNLIDAVIKYDFIQNALIGGILASIICGLIGAIIVEKHLVMMSSGIAHTSFGGIGLGYLMGFEPLYGAYLFAILSSLAITKIHKSSNTNTDSLIGIFWALGMAAGIVFIAIMPGYPPDVTSYLFGDILTISRSNLYLILATTILVLISIIPFYNYLKYYLFDEEFMHVRGFNTSLFDYLLALLIAISIVALIKVVGIILVIALLTIPPSIAKFYANSLRFIMIISAALGTSFTIIGLILSFYLNIPSGATIIFVSAIVYFISSFTFSRQNKNKEMIFK